MIWYLIILCFLLFVGVKVVYQPWKRYKHYIRQFQAKGYKVYTLGFNPFYVPFISIIQKGIKQDDPLLEVKSIYSENDVIVTNAFSKILIDCAHPDLIRDFYAVDKLYIYPKSKTLTAPISRAMGQGVPFSEGDVWKRKRRIVNKVFNFDFIRNMTPKIKELCIQAIKQTEKESVGIEGGYEYELLALTIEMFSSVVLQCFLGGAAQGKLEGQKISKFVNRLITDSTIQGSKLYTHIFGVKILNAGLTSKDRDINRRIRVFRQWGRGFVQKRIEEAKERINKDGKDKPPTDIIEALVREGMGAADGEEAYTNEEILEEFSTFFVAGTDTTSHLAIMMIYYIALNPEVEKKLREEIALYMKDMDFSYENLKNFKYIDNIQKETMRLYGPITGLLMRDVQEDNLLAGIPIYKGTYVGIQHLGNHYSEKYFKDPKAFRPERWDSECNNLAPFVTGGFSAGSRTCIGKHLALIESKIALILFYLRYKQVKIPCKKLKMVINLVVAPAPFNTKMTVNEDTRAIFS